ncbi:LamG domain-containing protein [Streptomyces pseudovenezuelae]|uniref:LamG domain-containing protein n=1 Tax=Streptomyces pseudovenezuelae TaxID=67350 RepID=UPI002E306052|nr:LamG domain-containing protein [Streptomyces pseudovenezuelae]
MSRRHVGVQGSCPERRGRDGRRFFAGAAVTALLAGLPVLGVPAPEARADATSEAQAASAQAAESGERVEVVGQRTEYSTTYANPDGLTFKLVQSAVPVRAKLADGSWAAPDATLERRADGSIGPKAAVLNVSLSDGGDGADLVTLADDGMSLSLGWPGALPKPALDGASALYANVLPGVDLRMTATVEGVRQVLVVKSAAGAANPKLKKLDFSLRTKGLTVRDGGGSLAAVDANGKTVFRAPSAQMWDSAGDSISSSPSAPSANVSQASFSLASAEGTTAADEDGSGEASADPTDGPGEGDASVVLPVSADTDSVTVTPDAGLLTGEDTVYPLYIDPDVSWGESERTLLSSDGDAFYNFSGGDDGKGVGYCDTYVTGGYAYYCGSGYRNRMYFEFSPSQLAGKQVLDVTFLITERFSMSCVPSWVDLVRTGNISSSTRWPGPTANWDLMVDRYVSAGRGSACDPSQPDKAIEFNDSSTEPNENLTSTVKKFAAGDISRLTLMLKAHDESDPNSWKRFDDDATLDVDFVGIPAKPTAIGLVTGDGTQCETDQSDPLIVSSPNPRLTATVQTAKGGEKDALLRAAFDLDKYTASNNSWSQAVDEMERPTSGHAADNTQLFADPPTLTDGTLYRYRTWTRSYYNSYNSHLSSASNAATNDWCYFKVDSSRPKAPGIAVASPYSRCTSNACAPGGGPGVDASFSFTPYSGDTNTAYMYKLSTEVSWSAPIPGSTVTKVITPSAPGTYTIFVRAKDTLGWGAQNAIDFVVDEGPGPVGQWHFDEPSGVAVDSSTTVTANQDNAALSASGASRDGRGRRGVITKDATGNDLGTPKTDTGLTLDGSAGYAATSGAVLETRASYTVSAWARIASAPAHNYAVVSQVSSDATASGFSIYYSTSYKGWIFNWHWRDSAGTSHIVRSYADQTSVPFGVWTHLGGVYDSKARTIQLYVNGKPQGAPVVLDSGQPAAANGGFLIGRTLYAAGSPTDYFGGQIDEVRAWQVRLTDALISTDARLMNSNGYAGAELVASWNPADASGTTLADSDSGYGRSLTLSGGAKLDGEGIVLQGPVSAATSSGPLVDETGSFTATAAVQLDADALVSKSGGYTAQVIGQRSADGSAWGFWYEFKSTEPDPETDKEAPVGFWHFGRLNADGSFTGVASDAAAMLGSPVRMTGVYDAQSGTVSLYLGLNQNGHDTAYTAVVGSGDFAVGEGFVNSAWGHYLPGSVTDIRVWAGAMASQDQIANTVGD